MTWIIAQPTILGQVIALSDIQVTFTNPENGQISYKDCVQKLYKMDHNIIAGFAGNVIGGFAMLSSLKRVIKKYKTDDDQIYEPEELITEWAKVAKSDFSRLKPVFKDGEVHLLIGGISHIHEIGIPGHGKPHVAILKSPNFIPEFAELGQWVSIGSGNYVEKYREILKDATGNPFHETMRDGEENYVRFITTMISSEIRDAPSVKGISKHFHTVCATKQNITGGTTNHTIISKEGERTKVIMPNVAHSLDEFLEILKKIGKANHKATATNIENKINLQ